MTIEYKQNCKSVPLIATTQIREWLSGKEIDCFEFVPIIKGLHKDCFAIEVPDDALSPMLNENDIIIVDPERRLKPGDYVLAQILPNMERFLVGQYIEVSFTEDGRKIFELRPTNSAYLSAYSERHNINILGVISGFHKFFFKSSNYRPDQKQTITCQRK